MSKNNIGPCPLCPHGTADQRLFGPVKTGPGKVENVCMYHMRNPGLDNSKEKVTRIKKAVEEINLGDWYKKQIEQRPEFCEEPGCGKRLIMRADMLHFTVCHIVPKSLFKSVAIHPA